MFAAAVSLLLRQELWGQTDELILLFSLVAWLRLLWLRAVIRHAGNRGCAMLRYKRRQPRIVGKCTLQRD